MNFSYNSKITPTWCPGCGDFVISMAIKKALTELGIDPTQVLFVFDIGCAGNMADKIGGYGFKGLHGRALPLASGAVIANSNVHVICIVGDGGLLNEGISHFIHCARSNYNITVIMHDNEGFALTTGQHTASTNKNSQSVSSPTGVIENELSSVKLALISGASFVARSYTGDFNSLTDLIKKGITHKGFSLINILQYCPTYNPTKTHEWFKQRVKPVSEIENYNTENLFEVLKVILQESIDFIPSGLIYQNSSEQDYLGKIEYIDKTLKELNLEDQNISDLLEEYK